MVEFLLLASLAVGALLLGAAIVLPLLAVGGLIWVILFPIRWLLNLVFWIVGGFAGLLLGPIVALVAGLAVAAALLAALVSLLAPLVPLVLLALLVWGAYRIAVPRAA